jgi:hypothetical protein
MKRITSSTQTLADSQTIAGAAESAIQITVLAEGLAFPEGPAFAADGSLWAVEYW